MVGAVSITRPIPDEHGIAHTAVGRACSFCGGLLQDPAVFWMLYDGELFLHPVCVFGLLIRLGRDVHEIEKPSYYADRRKRP